MPLTLRDELLDQALEVWAPSWPRRVNRTQEWADDPEAAAGELRRAEGSDYDEPFISTYSFPRGHTKQNNIPRVDTLFIDFDFEDGDYGPDNRSRDAWRRDLSHLLVRVRRVAEYIEENGREGWRASLSGHKGVHLFLDFPAVSPDTGSFDQFINGIAEYATSLVEHIEDETAIDSIHNYVDVTSSDLGRLCRVPNTLHGAATESFGEKRFCVPVTISELAEIDVDLYEELTASPRPVPAARSPNSDVGEVIAQHIRTAEEAGRNEQYSAAVIDWSRVRDYRENSNDSIALEDIEFLTSDRPCVWRFYQRDDKYRHGYQSHYMELYCIRELIEHNIPIDTIVEFLDSAPEFDEEYSRQRIKQVIALGYNRFSIEAVLRNAPEFSGYSDCALCQRVLADMDETTIHG